MISLSEQFPDPNSPETKFQKITDFMNKELQQLFLEYNLNSDEQLPIDDYFGALKTFLIAQAKLPENKKQDSQISQDVSETLHIVKTHSNEKIKRVFFLAELKAKELGII